MEIKKVLVTGPTGAVGYALLNECISRKIYVTAVCRCNSKRLNSIPKSKYISIVECNLDNLNSLYKILKKEYDVLFHLGWDGTYGDSRDDYNKQVLNIKYSLDAVSLAKEIGCKVFIGVGSQSEYGNINGIINPHSPCNPINGYGTAKYCASILTRLKCNELGLRHEWCRIVSLFGPNDGTYTLISSLINSLLKGERFKTTKGDQVWNYIYSKDAAKAFFAVAEKGKNNEIYLFCGNENRKLIDYIKSVRDIINPNVELGIGEIPYYKDQVMSLKVDNSNLYSDTGFKCSFSFEEGIKDLLSNKK